MHIAEVSTRIRSALKRRSGRQWQVRRHTQTKTPWINVSVGSRWGDPVEMTDEQVRLLADLFRVPLSDVPKDGISMLEETWEQWVDRAEEGIFLS